MNNEADRLSELEGYSILDTTADDDYDDITALASEICNTPISLITLIDKKRQWFKSHHGLDIEETPREYSFCAHAINDPDKTFVIKDAREDERFAANPLVTGDPYIVFYAGVPLNTENGQSLGTLCVIDRKPRELSHAQQKALEALANQVMKLLSLRKHKYALNRLNAKLKQKNRILENFAKVSATQIKSPLNIIASNYHKARTFLDQGKHDLALSSLELINESSQKLVALIDGLLSDARTDIVKADHKDAYTKEDLKIYLDRIFPKSSDYEINYFFSMDIIWTHIFSLQNILLELISNAIKHNDKTVAIVDVGGREVENYYEFFVSDNGPGLKEENIKKAFEAFTVLNRIDRAGEYGVGIGLTNVKKLVHELRGEIEVEAQAGEGAIFTFTIRK